MMRNWTKPFPTMSLRPAYGGIGQRSYLSVGGRAVAAIAAILFSAAALWAQAPVPNTSDAKPGDGACQQPGNTSARPSQAESQSGKESGEKKSTQAPDDPCASKSKDESEGKQTSRIMGVVPNFGAVSANTQLPPLSTKGKFWLATEDSFDYSAFVWTGIIAGQGFGLQN